MILEQFQWLSGGCRLSCTGLKKERIEIISHIAKVYIERDQLTYRIKQRDIQNRYIVLSEMQNMKI